MMLDFRYFNLTVISVASIVARCLAVPHPLGARCGLRVAELWSFVAGEPVGTQPEVPRLHFSKSGFPAQLSVICVAGQNCHKIRVVAEVMSESRMGWADLGGMTDSTTPVAGLAIQLGQIRGHDAGHCLLISAPMSR